MSDYPLFFKLAVGACLDAALIALYSLYDGALSIPRLLEGAPGQLKEELAEKQREAQSIWKKVRLIRNRALAHIDEILDVDQAFARAKLTPTEIRRLIDLSKELVNGLSYWHDRSTFAFNLDVEPETRRLLDLLVEGHRRRRQVPV